MQKVTRLFPPIIGEKDTDNIFWEKQAGIDCADPRRDDMREPCLTAMENFHEKLQDEGYTHFYEHGWRGKRFDRLYGKLAS